MQIYCPLDSPVIAFHRSLYLFCCQKPDCVRLKSLICLRTQLARENLFYSVEEEDNSDELTDKSISIKTPNLCNVCGFKAPFTCSKCQSTHYCSKIHQKYEWKEHKKVCGNNLIISNHTKQHPLLFPEYSILVEEEVMENVKEIIENGHSQSQACTLIHIYL